MRRIIENLTRQNEKIETKKEVPPITPYLGTVTHHIGLRKEAPSTMVLSFQQCIRCMKCDGFGRDVC